MKKTLLLCGLLFSAANAERATVTLSQPKNSGSCSDSAECPAGSACADGACTVYTVKDGTPGIDYTANKILTLETQLDSSRNALTCGSVSPGDGGLAGYRCIEHQVNLFMSDSEVVGNYDSSCSVEFDGGINGKMGGAVTSLVKDAENGIITCSYTPLNNKYLGYTSAKVTFTKSSGLKLGERAAKIIKVPMTYVPGSAAAGGGVGDEQYPEDPSLGNDAHHLITIPSASDGIHASNSTGGELQLSYRLNVMDDRYLIITQSGVEQLKQSAGDFSLVKEGLDIAGDYTTFYDPSLDSFLNSGANGVALDLDAYKSGDCHQRGQTHDGNGAVAMSDASCSAAYDQDNAQYHLEGVYKAKYGNMQHLKEQGGYFACPLCDNALAIQGFDNAGTPEIDVKIAIDASTLQSGCVGSESVKCVTFDNIFADLVASTAYKFDSDEPFLGQLFAPKVDGTISYKDLDDQFTIIGTHGDGNDRLLIAGSVAATVDCGEGHGAVNTLSSDMLASAQELFYEKCKISISGSYGDSSTITYKDEGKDDLVVTVHVVDSRRILVGSTELSLSRRQLASVNKIGAAITMDIVKHTEDQDATLTFDVIGTGSMVGYSDSATVCASGDVDVTSGCEEEAKSEEIVFTTSAVNGEIKQHTIRSSPSCNGFLDLQLKDQADPFAVYELRVPCSRTTTAVADKIDLKFDFSLSYDLLTNVMDAEALYLDNLPSASETNFDSGDMPAGLSQDLSVVAVYGTCGADDAISEKSGCDANAAFLDSAGNSKFVSASNSLAEWKTCSSVEDDFANGEQYKITTNIALQYTRDVSYATNGASFSNNKFCADRKYVTTISRDASATVTVATLSTPTLERAVAVTEIAWNTCADGFELQIDVKVNQKNVNDVAWSDGILSHVFKASSSASIDSDSLSIGFSGTKAAPSSVFNLRSACIAIPACDDQAFLALRETTTDLVLRGDFAGGDAVDSDVRISTDYLECPLDEENVALGGSLKAGATFVCNSDELSTIASEEVAAAGEAADGTGAANCDSAFTTGNGTAAVRLFLQADTAAAGDLLTDAEAALATTNGWEIRHNRISLERYEKLMNGDQGGLVSTTVICECGAIATSRQAGDTCSQAASGITGLDAFGSLTCNFESIDFDFLPLADATVDIIKVHFDILAENNNLDRRHLRHSIQLRSTSPVSAETSGFSVVQAAVHAESVPDASETTTAAPAEDEGLETGAIVGIIAGSVVLVAGGAWLWMRRNDKRASYTSVESEARQARFSNLRY